MAASIECGDDRRSWCNAREWCAVRVPVAAWMRQTATSFADLRGFAAPLAFTTALLALTLLPRLRQNEALTWSFWGAAAVLLALAGGAGAARRAGASATVRVGHAAGTALRPEPLPIRRLRVLGMVLAARLRFRAAAPRPAAVRLRVRHAAVVVAGRRLRPRVSAHSPSSSARTCFSGSKTTGSPAVRADRAWVCSARRSCVGSATAGACISSTRRRSRWRFSRSRSSPPARPS